MAYAEKVEYKLEIIPPWSIIQCRRADIVLKDGVEIARGYHRCVYSPGDDVSGACQEVQDVAAALWTPELIQEYQDHIDPTPVDPISSGDTADAPAEETTSSGEEATSSGEGGWVFGSGTTSSGEETTSSGEETTSSGEA